MKITAVEKDYEGGKWVPSYYGHRFTVACKLRVGGERDTAFKVSTFKEAKTEADRRNHEGRAS